MDRASSAHLVLNRRGDHPMRKTLLMSAAMLGLALAAPAVAQTSGGTGEMGTSGAAGAPGANPAMSQPGMANHTGMSNAGMGNEGTSRPMHRMHRAAQNNGGMTAEGARPGHSPGEGVSEPASTRASNINRADARSQIAPRLPTPSVGENASPESYVQAAQQALRRNRTGEAQEALERAETRVLEMHQADQGRIPMMDTLEQARQALGRHEVAEARRILDQSSFAENGARQPAAGYSGSGPMGGEQMGAGGMGSGPMGSGYTGAGRTGTGQMPAPAAPGSTSSRP
jgi:hypothetical protein